MVSFDCQDAISGIFSCSDKVTVGTEGANQVITGTAVDNAENEAMASVTLNVDKTPPNIAVISPADGSTVNVSNLTVEGTADDALSDIAGVTCNGIIASVNDAVFMCHLSLSPGTNTLVVEATDIAGNIAEVNVEVNFQDSLEAAISTALEHLATDGVVFDDTVWKISIVEGDEIWIIVLTRLPPNENILILGDEHHVSVSKISNVIVDIAHFQ